MKRFASFAILTVLLCFSIMAAQATPYTDDENRITVEIPQGDAVYYYTPNDTNMFEDLLEQVQSSGRDVRLLVRSYTPDYLGWSLEITASPLERSSSGEDPQTQDDALIAPSSSPAPATSIEFTDITAASEDEQVQEVELVRSTYQGRFNFSNPHEGLLKDVPALVMDGTGVADSIWGAYDATVYLITNTERLLTISLIYQRAEDNGFEQQAEAMLSGMLLGDVPAPTPTPVQTSAAPTTPAPTATPERTAAPVATASPTASNFFANLWHNIQDTFETHPNLIYYTMIAAALILLVIALIIHLRNLRRRREWAFEEENDWDRVEARISPDQTVSADTEAAFDKPRKIEMIEERNMISERPVQHSHKDQDYSEDIFRYTQQPGPEVNDVSRFTHGYDDDVDDELKKLQDQSFVEPKPVKIESVGSRVERNRRKRK